MPILALLLAAAAPSQAPAASNLDANMCVGPCPVLPDPNLRPLAFLAGSCWRATYPLGRGADTHCFTWIFGGRFLRERRRGALAGDSGETIYHWDASARQIRWDYYSSRGPLGSGTASATEDGLAFAYRSADFGHPVATRVDWRRDGPDSYVETTQYRQHGRWRTEPGPPRYRRIGPAPPD
jgi:hypothetical protein